MSEALATIPRSLNIPPGCSLRQFRFAELIVQRKDDDPTSWTELGRIAGYSESSMRSSALVIREASGVRRAIASIQAEAAGERDKARDLRTGSVDAMLARVADGSASDVLLLGAVTKSIEIENAAGPQTEEASLPPSWYRGQRRRALLRAYQLGLAAGRAAAAQQQD